jgi:hypothetical protein
MSKIVPMQFARTFLPQVVSADQVTADFLSELLQPNPTGAIVVVAGTFMRQYASRTKVLHAAYLRANRRTEAAQKKMRDSGITA